MDRPRGSLGKELSRQKEPQEGTPLPHSLRSHTTRAQSSNPRIGRGCEDSHRFVEHVQIWPGADPRSHLAFSCLQFPSLQPLPVFVSPDLDAAS